MRERAVVDARVGQLDRFGSLSLFDFINRFGSANTPAFSFPFADSGFALLLRFFAIGLIETLGRVLAVELFELFLKLIDPIVQHHDDVDQPVGRQSPSRSIVPELLNIHAPSWPKTGESAKSGFREWIATTY